MRYLTPSILTAVTAWMWHYNRTDADSRLVFPFLDVLLPGVASDPQKMAEVSLQLAVGITVIAWGLAALGHVREVRARRALAAMESGDAD